MVLSANPGEGTNYVYSRVGDGGLRETRFDGYLDYFKNLKFTKQIKIAQQSFTLYTLRVVWSKVAKLLIPPLIKMLSYKLVRM